MPTPLVSKFSALRALGCGVIGVAVSFLFDHFGAHRVSTAVGLFVSVTLVLIVFGIPYRKSVAIWVAFSAFSLLNLVGALVFYHNPSLEPLATAPVLLLEVAWYLTLMSRIRKRLR